MIITRDLNITEKYFFPRPILTGNTIRRKQSGGPGYYFADSYKPFGEDNTLYLRCAQWERGYLENNLDGQVFAEVEESGIVQWRIIIGRGAFFLSGPNNISGVRFENLLDCWLAFFEAGCDGNKELFKAEAERVRLSKKFRKTPNVFAMKGGGYKYYDIWVQKLFEIDDFIFYREIFTGHRFKSERDNIFVSNIKTNAYVGNINFRVLDGKWIAGFDYMNSTKNKKGRCETIGKAFSWLINERAELEQLSHHKRLPLAAKAQEIENLLLGAEQMDDAAAKTGITVLPY